MIHADYLTEKLNSYMVAHMKQIEKVIFYSRRRSSIICAGLVFGFAGFFVTNTASFVLFFLITASITHCLGLYNTRMIKRHERNAAHIELIIKRLEDRFADYVIARNEQRNL